MILWKKIKDQDDVELSEDGKTLEVLYDTDNQGNYYIEIPIEIIRKAMGLKCKYIWKEGAGCKLTKEQVLQIIKMDGSQSKIAKVFGVTQSYVSELKLGKKWSYLRATI